MKKPFYVKQMYIKGKSRFVLCSHNWKDGDTIYHYDNGNRNYPTTSKLKSKEGKDAIFWKASNSDLINESWSGLRFFKVVAEIPKHINWVSMDMTFDESEVKIPTAKKLPMAKFKCPTCKKIH